jgi:hypothetical protein
MTHPFIVADPSPKSLSSEAIIFRSADMEHIAEGYVYYTIQFWAFSFLKNNRQLLGLPRSRDYAKLAK